MSTGAVDPVDWPSLMPEVALALLGEPRRRNGPDWRWNRHGSLSVDVAKGIWKDFESGCGGGVIALVKHIRGVGDDEASAWLRARTLMRCEDPRSAGATRHRGRHGVRPKSGGHMRSATTTRVVTELVRPLWTRGAPVAPRCAGARYLAHRRVWIGEATLPCPSVRWLSKDAWPEIPRGFPLAHGAAGALVFAWHRLEDHAVTSVCLTAIAPDGRRLPWFAHGAKTTCVGPRRGAVFIARPGDDTEPTHLCEGELDALALASPEVPWCLSGRVLALGGSSGLAKASQALSSIVKQLRGGVIIHADHDAAGGIAAHKGRLGLLAAQGFTSEVRVERSPEAGVDPADRVAKWRADDE